MHRTIVVASAVLFLLASLGTGSVQTMQKKGLTLGRAQMVIAAAIAGARSKDALGGAIAAVDEGGNRVAALKAR